MQSGYGFITGRKWLTENFSGTWDGGTRRAWCDASNFHLCVNAIRDKQKEDKLSYDI